MTIELRPLTTEKLPEFRALLGSKDFGGCFCAVWTSFGEDWATRCADKSQPNYFITEKNVEARKHVGFLVYEDSSLVGWTGSGPKTSFPFLKSKLGSRLSDFSDYIWSVGCLAISKSARGRGLSEPIVKAIASEAKKNSAKVLEAYPTRPWDEPRMFRGSFRLYERLGFVEINSEKDGSSEILLMQLKVG
jgi:GNAT superfamily N-acetyltransferase